MDKIRDAESRMRTVDPLVTAQVKDTAALRRYNDMKSKLQGQIDSLKRRMMPGEDVQGIYEDPAQLVNQLQSLYFYLDPAFGTPNPPLGAPPSTFGLSMKKVRANADAFNKSVQAFEQGPWRDYENLVKGLNLQLLQPLGQ
jgi:hypothetical protein